MGLAQLTIAFVTLVFLVSCQGSEFKEARRVKSYTDADFLTQTFTVADLIAVQLSFNPETEHASQLIELKEPRLYQEEWVQLTRPLERSRFYQGHEGFQETEILSLREAGRLDLLIVMDDSSSMHPYQEMMKVRFAELLSRISNTDWQIAVVTTTTSCLRQSSDGIKILRRDDFRRDPETARRRFEELITPGEYGNTKERGILMATEGLIGDCGNPSRPWTRADSEKAVLIVSDEKNCGSASNEGCPGRPYEKAEYFLDRAPTGSRVYGLFHFQDDFVQCPWSGGYEDMYPTEYMRLIEATGGFAEEICQRDYSRVLSLVSAHVEEFLRKQFSLKYVPETKSIQVELNGEVLSEGFRLDGRNLVLDRTIDDPDAMITVRYRHNPVPIVDRFLIDQSVDPRSLKVYVNQRQMSKDTFHFDQERRALIFHDMPEPRAIIDLEFRMEGFLQKNFQTSLPEDLHGMTLYVNNRPVSNYTWDPLWRQIRFSEAPQDGARIRLDYSRIQDLELEYPIQGVSAEMIERVWVENSSNQQIDDIHVEVHGDHVRFSAANFQGGKQLRLIYQMEVPDRNQPINWSLPEHWLVDSLLISSSDQDCGQLLEMSERSVKFRCDSADRAGFSVYYEYYDQLRHRFLVDPNNLMPRVLEVWINGIETKDFRRDGPWLVVNPKNLQPDDVVTVRGLLEP